MKKALGETPTLWVGCKAGAKNFAPLHTSFPGARDAKI